MYLSFWHLQARDLENVVFLFVWHFLSNDMIFMFIERIMALTIAIPRWLIGPKAVSFHCVAREAVLTSYSCSAFFPTGQTSRISSTLAIL